MKDRMGESGGRSKTALCAFAPLRFIFPFGCNREWHRESETKQQERKDAATQRKAGAFMRLKPVANSYLARRLGDSRAKCSK
jgi:hypothetical protein